MTTIEAALIIVITTGSGTTSQMVNFPDMIDCLVAALEVDKQDGVWAFCIDVTGATE